MAVSKEDVTENRRVLHSKSAIRASFFQLLNEKPLEKITVKELCLNAGVNRGTFYRYYSDIFDLFHSIEAEFSGELDRCLNSASHNSTERFLADVFELIRRNKDLVIILLSGDAGNLGFFEEAVHRYYDKFVAKWSRYVDADANESILLYDVVFGSMSRVIIDWLRGNIAMSAEEISSFLISTFLDGAGSRIHLPVPSETGEA